MSAQSADLLRRAAALMRERAEAAETEHRVEQTLARGVIRCSCGASSVGDPGWKEAHLALLRWQPSRNDATQVWDERERLVASAEGLGESAHIASWHPAVALAVADWLDAAPTTTGGVMNRHALAVARAYLGEPE